MCEGVPNIKKVRYNDKFLRLASDGMQDVFRYAQYWSRLSDEKRFSVLESCKMMKMAIPHLQGARLRGELTRKQLRELNILERRYGEAKGLLKILEQWDKSWYERGKDHDTS